MKKLSVLLVSILMVFSATVSAQTWDLEFEWPDAPCPAACGEVDGYKINQVGGGLVVDTGALTAPVDGQTIVSGFVIGFGEELCFTILGYNDAGDGLDSIPACVTTPDQQVPGQTSLIIRFQQP